MLSRAELDRARERAAVALAEAGIVLAQAQAHREATHWCMSTSTLGFWVKG